MTGGYTKIVYAFWAKIYDSIIDPLFYFDRKKVISALGIKSKDHVLEVGVGTGLNLPYYPRCKITGIDFSSAMLRKVQRKSGVLLRQEDARKMSFKDGTFDAALTTYVLRVSPEPHKIMQEVSRVVKKNGLFVIVDQFKGKNTIFLKLIQPFKMLLGWGKEYDLSELLQGTPWKVISNKQFGKMSNTRLVVLRNAK